MACEILKGEIESLTQGDPDIIHRDYLEFALHLYPKEMRSIIVDKINALEGQVDAVFLGYGVCQSLAGIAKEVKVPSVMLEFDDCISALLGPAEYAREKRVCTGTWFASPGWAEKGLNGLIKELHLDALMNEGHDPMEFVKIIFAGYSRALFIDTGIGENEHLQRMSLEFAARLGLHHDCRKCSLQAISDALKRTKALAIAKED